MIWGNVYPHSHISHDKYAANTDLVIDILNIQQRAPGSTGSVLIYKCLGLLRAGADTTNFELFNLCSFQKFPYVEFVFKNGIVFLYFLEVTLHLFYNTQ